MKHSKSSLLLIEMIICIFFFGLSAAICSQFFAKAHLTSKDTIEENYGEIIVQNLAECFYATNGDFEQIVSEHYNGYAVCDDNGFTIYFDSDFAMLPAGEESFNPELLPSDSENSNSNTAFLSADSKCAYCARLALSDSSSDEAAEFVNATAKFYEIKHNENNCFKEEIYSIEVKVNVPLTLNEVKEDK